jgi:L-histidine Nalpha-methyltransferase
MSDVRVLLDATELTAALRSDVAAGLTATPKELLPKYLYDERGSALYEQITRLPEYYPFRAESAILAEHAKDVVVTSGADTLVELGSGTSEKTRFLLDAMRDEGVLRRFVAFDVAESTLRAALVTIAADYPGTTTAGVVGDFERHLGELPLDGHRVVALLGGTIGNLKPAQRSALLATIAAGLRPGECLLLGTDLVKDRHRLVAAYDDAAGVTAQFNLNVLTTINRELGADFDLDRFAHVARFDEDEEWIEMRLRSLVDQTVHVDAVGLSVPFSAGEEMRTEVSAKFRPERAHRELEQAGLDVVECWTDDAGDFAVWLARR